MKTKRFVKKNVTKNNFIVNPKINTTVKNHTAFKKKLNKFC